MLLLDVVGVGLALVGWAAGDYWSLETWLTHVLAVHLVSLSMVCSTTWLQKVLLAIAVRLPLLWTLWLFLVVLRTVLPL